MNAVMLVTLLLLGIGAPVAAHIAAGELMGLVIATGNEDL